MTGPKPCANCTCGLKEKYDQEQLANGVSKEDLEKGNVESSCGKCYLGDAFRCAGCPYRGLPAFEKGDKVKLVNTDSQQQTNLAGDRIEAVTQPCAGGSGTTQQNGEAKKSKVVLNTDDMDMDF